MYELQLHRMEGLPRESKERSPPVERIGDQGMTARSQMHADLVRASCVQRAAQCTDETADGNAPHVGARSLSRLDHCHANARARVPTDRRVDGHRRRFHFAVGECQVLPVDFPGRNRARERRHGRQRLGNDHESRRVLVQPVHDAGTGQRGSARMVREQPIQKRSPPMAGRGMDDEAGRLVDHQKLLILEDDRQRNGLGAEGAALGGRHQVDFDALADADLSRRHSDYRAVQANMAGLDQRLKMTARELGGHRDDRLVQACLMEGCVRDRAAGLDIVVELVGLRDPKPIIALVFLHRVPARPVDAMTGSRLWRRAAMLAAIVLMAACGSSPKEDNSQQAVDKLYAEAKDDMAAGGYDRAIKSLERVEGRAAGTLLAQQAQIDLAYSYWKTGERAQALSTLDRFIRLNPSSPALDYALYLRGLVNFNDNLGIFGFISRQDLSERDQQASRDAYQSFKQLAEQFPQSRYAQDARVRMDYIVNALAAYEVHVARYYYRRGAYVAAVNRAQAALQEFQQAPATEEALFIMARSYDRLGLDALRDDADRVLKQNFPNSRYLTDGVRPPDRAWWQFW